MYFLEYFRGWGMGRIGVARPTRAQAMRHFSNRRRKTHLSARLLGQALVYPAARPPDRVINRRRATVQNDRAAIVLGSFINHHIAHARARRSANLWKLDFDPDGHECVLMTRCTHSIWQDGSAGMRDKPAVGANSQRSGLIAIADFEALSASCHFATIADRFCAVG